MWKEISIDFKYIDIAQNLTIQWAIMCDMGNFPEPEEKWAHLRLIKNTSIMITQLIICISNGFICSK